MKAKPLNLSMLVATALAAWVAGCSSTPESKSAPESKPPSKAQAETPLPAGAIVEITPALPTTVSTKGSIYTVKATWPNGIGISEIPVYLRLSPVTGNQVGTSISTFKRLNPNSPTSELTEEGLVVHGATRAGGVYHFKLTASHVGNRDRLELVVGDKKYQAEFDTVEAAK